MLRPLLSKHKTAKIFEKHLNPILFVFIGKLSLSTHVPGFQSFFRFFASFFIGQISDRQHDG